ncbi:hypothetical protein Bbelb_340950 [Branchiostoma belcheri]|nr:hypothetical protein Bbelb_340950 [Branchiostoma belcheri]
MSRDLHATACLLVLTLLPLVPEGDIPLLPHRPPSRLLSSQILPNYATRDNKNVVQDVVSWGTLRQPARELHCQVLIHRHKAPFEAPFSLYVIFHPLRFIFHQFNTLHAPTVRMEVHAAHGYACLVTALLLRYAGNGYQPEQPGTDGDVVVSRPGCHLRTDHGSCRPAANPAASSPSSYRRLGPADRRGVRTLQRIPLPDSSECEPDIANLKGKSPTELLDSLLLSGYDARIRPNFNVRFPSYEKEFPSRYGTVKRSIPQRDLYGSIELTVTNHNMADTEDRKVTPLRQLKLE